MTQTSKGRFQIMAREKARVVMAINVMCYNAYFHCFNLINSAIVSRLFSIFVVLHSSSLSNFSYCECMSANVSAKLYFIVTNKCHKVQINEFSTPHLYTNTTGILI